MTKAWQQRPFLEVFSDETGGNIKTLQTEYLEVGQFPIVDQGQELVGGFTNDNARLCQVKAPVIVFGDHTKCFKYIDFPFCLGADGTKILKPKITADERYLFYFLQTVRIPDAGYSRHFKYLKEAVIPLPPLDEQKRIAAILDQADNLRRKRQRALDRLSQLGQAIFVEMFGDPAKNPKRLQVSALVEVVSRVTDGEHQTPRRSDGGYKLLSARNVRDGYIDFENVDYVDEEEFTRIAKRCAPKFGDILISCSGTIGRVAVVSTQEPFALVRSAALVVPDEAKISPHYLAEYLRTPYMFRGMNQAANSSGQPNLFQNQIKRLPVIVPPIEEQMKFATLIAEIRNKPMLEQEASLNSMKSLFVSLQHRAFHGELTASSLKEAAA